MAHNYAHARFDDIDLDIRSQWIGNAHARFDDIDLDTIKVTVDR